MESAKRGRAPAPYGQACAHCVKAKSRCMLRDGGTCERCHRLDKECTPSSFVRKKSIKKPTASKRAQLEDKLDDLVSILRTQHANPERDATRFQAVTTRSLESTPHPNSVEAVCDDSITEEELMKFRELHLPHFPLINLPSTLSAEQLNHEKPLLSLAIKTICNKAHSTQAKLSKRLREIIALKMIVDGDKSLDLLLSVLSCMTWSIYFTSGKRFISMLAGLARSLVSDLRLDKPETLSWCPAVGPYEKDETFRSNESRRAHVACFALSTTISTTFKHDMMQWSPQLEQDCLQLAMEAEVEGDELLVSMARISRICLQVADVNRHLSDNNASIVAFKSTAQMSIYELILLHSPNQTIQSRLDFDHRRADHLMACLQLCKQYTEQYLKSDFINITSPTSLVFARCLENLHKLATLPDAGWDPTIVRQTVSIVELLDLCAAGAERVDAKLREETGENSVFAMVAKAVRDSAPPNWRVPNPEPQGGADAVMEGWTGTEALDLPFVDFSDDLWLNTPFYL
ncbi:hypothetical protein BDW02DRAFT_402551 [Decorospora gaudefroyi]|uniref:Zn(2)-C6 fungal-type domain-containing protein n=1 Tax=Decorospora gaudefroyi TaxID=184978 RepID=A0A6A5KCD7_9PLEO|nr:hypothetical protein BDW02DRAFT_402551 [Decorospora gaudefroyi]